MKKAKLLLFCLLLFLMRTSFAKNITISGFIYDSVSGEALLYSTVIDLNTNKGVTANEYGFYSITTNPGQIKLKYSFIGYGEKTLKFYAINDTVLNIKLSTQNELEEVVIESEKNEIVNSTQMSISKIDLKKTDLLPKLAGESDLLKSIQLKPGVQTGSEGTGGLYVRGGGQGDNLVLLDGAPVYSLNHFWGLFSVFNIDALQNVELYKGGFPARYGGRLSSVLDIRMKEGNNQNFGGSGSLGLVSSKILLEGPIVKDKTSFIISGRRSNIDYLIKPLSAEIDNIFFYDLNFKVNHKFSSKSRLFFSYYQSKDKFGMNIDQSFLSGEDTESVPSLNNFVTCVGWDNVSSSLRWNQVITNKLFFNSTLTYSSYGTDKDFNLKSTIYGKDQEENVVDFFDLQSKSANLDFSWFPVNQHYIKFGGSYIDNQFPFKQQRKLESDGLVVYDTVYWDTILHAREIHGYIEDNIELLPNLKAQVGVHASLYNIQKKWYNSFEPRITLRYKLKPTWSIKAAYSEMTQYMFQKPNVFEGYRNENGISFSLNPELWLPCTKKLPPQKSKQVVLGTYYNLNDKYEFSIEGFYKDLENVIYNSDIPDTVSTNNWEDIFLSGKGRSYGLEFLLEKNSGKLNGAVSYTLSKTDRKYDEISNGEFFPYMFDRRHNLNVVLNYFINKRIDIGAIWVYYSGRRITLSDGQYVSNFNLNSPAGVNNKNDLYVLSSENAYQLPDYNRLDLSCNFHKERKRFSRTLSLGIYNAYNQHNPFLVFFDNTSNKYRDSGKKTIKSLSMFPFLPYINYTIKF